VFLPDLEKRLQANPAEKKRIQEEIENFKTQYEKDQKTAEMNKKYPQNVNNPNTGLIING